MGAGQAETIQDVPFALNTTLPVPPDFQAAYQRNALIVVQFYKPSTDPFYPQGLTVDRQVARYLQRLRSKYPTVEFFSYDITNPGDAESSEELEQGQYGTLAAQLGVGYTPFVATLAPTGDGYVIENLFQGYVPRPVLSQALFDLTAASDVQGNTSDVDVTIEQIELTETGGGIEYVTIKNRSSRPVDLAGFTLNTLDPETGEVDPGSEGLLIGVGGGEDGQIRVPPSGTVSVGREPDVVDADGEKVVGTFSGGEALDLSPGDQVALLDSGGAVAATITV